MAPSPDTQSLLELLNTIINTLRQLASSLAETSPSLLTGPLHDPPNPLHVIRDSAPLIKAHTTRLSLLAINKPFTPSAVIKVLTPLAASCLPALMSAAQICEQEKATVSKLMAVEVRVRVRRVVVEMITLLEEVRSIAQGNGGGARRDSLSSTGVVWERCDALIELERMGAGGLAVQKAEQYCDQIKDAIEELKAWKDGEDLETEGHDELLDEADEGVDGDRDSVEDIFHAANSMPRDRPEWRELMEEVDGKLKKVVLLYTAVIKRRLKTFTAVGIGREAAVKRLDECMYHLHGAPHRVDDLANMAYGLDQGLVEEMLSHSMNHASSAADSVRLDWENGFDEFSAWFGKWEEIVR